MYVHLLELSFQLATSGNKHKQLGVTHSSTVGNSRQFALEDFSYSHLAYMVEPHSSNEDVLVTVG